MQEVYGNELPLSVAEYRRCSPGICDHQIVSSGTRSVGAANVAKFNGVTKIFNHPLPPGTQDNDSLVNSIIQFLENSVWPKLDKSCKIGVEMGSILDMYKDFFPNFNTSVLPKNDVSLSRLMPVNSRLDLTDLCRALRTVDLEETVASNVDKPDSSCRHVLFTNVAIRVFDTVAPVVGSDTTEEEAESAEERHKAKVAQELQWLPQAVIPRIPERMTDSLWNPPSKKGEGKMACLWQCIAHRRQRTVKFILKEFCKWRKETLGLTTPTPQEYAEKGISLPLLLHGVQKEDDEEEEVECTEKGNLTKHLGDMRKLVVQIEECFRMNINIFYVDEGCLKRLTDHVCQKKAVSEKVGRDAVMKRRGGARLVLCTAHMSCNKHGSHKRDNCDILLGSTGDEVHCYLMTKDTKSWIRTFRCHLCSGGYKTRKTLKQHVEKGVCLSRFKYPGGVYQRQKSVWEHLQEEGINYSTACNPGDGPVPLVNQYACWDIETRPVM